MNLKLSIKKNSENAIQVEKEHEHTYLFAKYNYFLCHVPSNIIMTLRTEGLVIFFLSRMRVTDTMIHKLNI